MFRYLPLLISLLISIVTQAQSDVTYSIKGTIKDAANIGLPGANVWIEEINKGTMTDENGNYQIQSIPPGKYTLIITSIGYQTIKSVIKVDKDVILHFPMQEAIAEMEQIEVMAKGKSQTLKEEPIKAEVINTKEAQQESATLNELMNRSAGIRVRQTGGLGSNASLMVNGFQGRAIKYFKDGIPMDYLGAGYNISLVPVNMLDRVEVYKGVLPVALGADALGGAVNLVTKREFKRNLSASYEVASFNTHRISLNAFYQDTSRHLFIGADAFYNYSDNNYEVTVKITDPETSTLYPAKVKLFHNRFTNFYTEVYTGINNTKWADELRFGLTYFIIDRQNQYGATMIKPFGAAQGNQYSWVPTLRYRKTFFKNRLSLDQFLVYNKLHVDLTDTLKGTYDWYGNYTPSAARYGETSESGSLSRLVFTNYTSRTGLSFQLTPSQRVEFNTVYVSSQRIGSDPFGKTLPTSGRDVLTLPADYSKMISALGLESKLWNRFTNHFIVKYYLINTKGTVGSYADPAESATQSSTHRWGVAEAVKLSVSQNSFFRTSAELATRLPEQNEVFGDGNFRLANFSLKPEKSTNINLGFRTEKVKRFYVELNTFYRITKDLIIEIPVGLFSQNQNINNVKGFGIESDAQVQLLKWLSVNGNFTYQRFRQFNSINPIEENALLRNTPFFFANLGLRTHFNDIGYSNSKLQAYWYYSFVKEYYLEPIPESQEPDGFLGLWGKARLNYSDKIIPDQNLHTVGITYMMKGNASSVGIEVKNIFNSSLYDNYRVQNAGRSYHLKLRYTFH